MHVTLSNPESKGQKAIMCIERDAQLCIILCADAEQASTLADVAGGMGVPEVLIIVRSANEITALADRGWKSAPGIGILSRRLVNGK